MDSRKLRYLVEAIDQGSLNRAAESLRLSQPALSKAIRLLELELGVPLLDRMSGGVRPTQFGKAIYSHAKAVVAEIAGARAQIESLKSAEQHQIVIGTLSTFVGPIVAPALARLHARRERIPSIKIVEKPEVELIPELRQGAFDFIIGIVQGGKPAEGLQERVLLFDERKLIVRAHHPLTKLKSVTLADLVQYPWILPTAGTLHRAPMEQLFRDAKLEPPRSMIEGGSLSFHLQLILASDHIVALSAHAVSLELRLRQLAIVSITLPPLRRTIGIITRDNHRIPAAATNLVKHIEAVSRDLAG